MLKENTLLIIFGTTSNTYNYFNSFLDVLLFTTTQKHHQEQSTIITQWKINTLCKFAGTPSISNSFST